MVGDWTPEKDAQRKQLNSEFAKLRRDKTRVKKYGPRPKNCSSNDSSLSIASANSELNDKKPKSKP
jgi:hypothetical protein